MSSHAYATNSYPDVDPTVEHLPVTYADEKAAKGVRDRVQIRFPPIP